MELEGWLALGGRELKVRRLGLGLVPWATVVVVEAVVVVWHIAGIVGVDWDILVAVDRKMVAYLMVLKMNIAVAEEDILGVEEIAYIIVVGGDQ